MALARRYCPHCEEYTPSTRNELPHILFFFLSLFTCWMFLPIWIFMTICSAWNCTRCGSKAYLSWWTAPQYTLSALILAVVFVGIIGYSMVSILMRTNTEPVAAQPLQKPRPPFAAPLKPAVNPPVIPAAQQIPAGNAPVDQMPAVVAPVAPVADPDPFGVDKAKADAEAAAAESAIQEKKARGKLAVALQVSDKARRRKRLQEVIDEYPGTTAAADAQVELDK